MKRLFFLKTFFTLTLAVLGLASVPTPARAEMFGSGGEIVVYSLGEQVAFDHAYINLSNWNNQGNMFGMPRKQTFIAKGETVTLNNTFEGFASLHFNQEEDGNIRIDFPTGLLSKRNPHDGCGNGPIAKGCGPADAGEVYGVGFANSAQERIYSEAPAFFTGEGIKVAVRPSTGEALLPVTDPVFHTMPHGSFVKITVKDYPAPQIPGGPQALNDNEDLTRLDHDDYLNVNLFVNPEDPKHQGLLQDDDHKITVHYLDGGVEKTEAFPLRGGLDLRFYGPQANFVRARASVAFPDALDIQAESTSSAFTKLEYWSRGENPELKGSFLKGPVTKVQFFTQSGAFSYVFNTPAQNPGEFGMAAAFKIDSGDSLTLLQEGAYLTVRTHAPEIEAAPAQPGLAFHPKPGGNGVNVPGFDPVDGDKSPAFFDDLNILGQGSKGPDFTIGGGGCSLNATTLPWSGWQLFGLLGGALPMVLKRNRGK